MAWKVFGSPAIGVKAHRARWVVAKVAWLWGELFPRVGFIVTNMTAGPEGVIRVYNGEGQPSSGSRRGVR